MFGGQIGATADVGSLTHACCLLRVQRHETLYRSVTAFVICDRAQEIRTAHKQGSDRYFYPPEMYAPSEMCREVREEDVESW